MQNNSTTYMNDMWLFKNTQYHFFLQMCLIMMTLYRWRTCCKYRWKPATNKIYRLFRTFYFKSGALSAAMQIYSKKYIKTPPSLLTIGFNSLWARIPDLLFVLNYYRTDPISCFLNWYEIQSYLIASNHLCNASSLRLHLLWFIRFFN